MYSGSCGAAEAEVGSHELYELRGLYDVYADSEEGAGEGIYSHLRQRK